MSRTVIRYPGRPPRFVGPFGDERVAREWFAEHGGGVARVSFIELEQPDPPPKRLPAIPRRVRLSPSHCGFMRLPELADDDRDEWFILGRETDVPLGRDVKVYQRSTQEWVTVHINYYVAERVINHCSPEGEPEGTTRYVIAAFTNEICEDQGGR